MRFDQKVRAACVEMIDRCVENPAWPRSSDARASFLAVEVRRKLFPNARSFERKLRLVERARPIAALVLGEYAEQQKRFKIAAASAVQTLQEHGVDPDPPLVALFVLQYFHPEVTTDIFYPTRKGLRETTLRPISRAIVEHMNLAQLSEARRAI